MLYGPSRFHTTRPGVLVSYAPGSRSPSRGHIQLRSTGSLRYVLPSEGVAVSVSLCFIARGKTHTGRGPTRRVPHTRRFRRKHLRSLDASSPRSFTCPLLHGLTLETALTPSRISAAFTAAVDSSGRSDRRQFRSGQLAGARNFGERAESFASMFSPARRY